MAYKQGKLMYLIYKHTSPSGKSYIGQTKNLSRRNKRHKDSIGGCTVFHRAILKYGFDNFNTEILAQDLTLEEANILEEQFIKDYNTLVPNGYNLTPGGNNKTHHELTRQLLRVKRLQRPPPPGKKVKVGLIIYESLSSAARTLNIHTTSLLYRIKSDNYPEYEYLI